MKISLSTIGLLFAGVATLSAQTLRVAPRSADLGDIALKSKHRIEVICHNEGQSPVVITDIRTGCVCTKPTWKKAPVMPGDSTTVVLQFSPTDRGAFYKTIRFETAPGGGAGPEIILRGKVF